MLCIDGVVALIIEFLEEQKYWSRALTKLSTTLNRACRDILSPRRDTGSLWIKIYRGRWDNCPFTNELTPVLKWFIVEGKPQLSAEDANKDKLYSIDEWKGRFVLRVLGEKTTRETTRRYTTPTPFLNNNQSAPYNNRRKRTKRVGTAPVLGGSPYIWCVRVLSSVRKQRKLQSLLKPKPAPEETIETDTLTAAALFCAEQLRAQANSSSNSSTSSSSPVLPKPVLPKPVSVKVHTSTSIDSRIEERKRKQREKEEDDKKEDPLHLREWKDVENLIPPDILDVLNKCGPKDNPWRVLIPKQQAFFTVLSQLDKARYCSSKGLWITKGGTCVAGKKDLPSRPTSLHETII